MAIHWQIPFMSLRSNPAMVYTVNIYDDDYSGNPVVLKGGAEPFTTEEEDSENQFAEIRTQTGYLRYVDDGFAADGITAVNWKDILPETDTDRPVTLTDSGGNVKWQGFMQAQNFSGTLYGNPQERELPIQCALSVLEGSKINYEQTSVKNFAYLLKQIIDSIPSICRPNTIHIGGGNDAKLWLLKCIDWQNFVETDEDNNLSAKYSMYQCLEDMCRFWGWTARTHGQHLYLTCTDDDAEQSWLTLSDSQLTTMAGGTAAGSVSSTWGNLILSGNEFASINNDETMVRGIGKSKVTADCNSFEESIFSAFPDKVTKEMDKGGWQGYVQYDEVSVNYTNNLLNFSDFFMSGSAVSGKSSFNLAMCAGENISDKIKVIRILNTYDGNIFASLESRYEHLFDGYFTLSAKAYRCGKMYKESRGVYNKTMKMSIGIGSSRNSAVWFDGFAGWSSTKTIFSVLLGYNDNKLRVYSGILSSTAINTNNTPTGKLFVDFYGSTDIEEYNGKRIFDIADFVIEYTRMENETDFTKIERLSTLKYKAENNSKSPEKWNADCIFASDNNNNFGFGTIINTDNTYVETIEYNGNDEHPEQHLANRVVNFWNRSRRLVRPELLANAVPDVSPLYKVTVDGTICYPISISRNWRDDILKLVLLEM